MSYNGIGLGTAKGSGTSGHVQKNISRVNKSQDEGKQFLKRQLNQKRISYTTKIDKLKNMEIDPQILEHERKRNIEVQISELRDKLEDEDKNEEEIQKLLEHFRSKLIEQQHYVEHSSYKSKVNPFMESKKVKE